MKNFQKSGSTENRIGRGRLGTFSHEEESSAEEAADEASHQDEPQVAQPSRQVQKTFFQQYGMGIVFGAIVVGMLGFKQYTKMHADQMLEPARGPTSVSGMIEGDYQRKPINQVLKDIAPEQAQAVPQATVPVVLPQPTAILNEVPAVDPAIVEKLADLTERMAALESERNHLRDENEKLKRKAEPAPKPSKPVVAKKVEPRLPEAIAVPARAAATNIQYLGTFNDGDRLVAELLYNGKLARVKRGDNLSGGRRVDAVSEMSVTIDDVVYSP